jgi:hypothetical protein
MENVKKIELKDQKIKVVFKNETDSDEKELFIEFECKKEGDIKVTTVGLDPLIFNTEASFIGSIYMDTVNVLMTIKKLFDNKEPYEGLHVLTRAEYKEYVTKVLGLKIED